LSFTETQQGAAAKEAADNKTAKHQEVREVVAGEHCGVKAIVRLTGA